MNLIEGNGALAYALDAPVANGNDERPRSMSKRPGPARGFALSIDGEASETPLLCAEVHGFREALLASMYARSWAPTRLMIVAPELATAAWLEAWSEDGDRVRRALTFVRRFDDRKVTVIATLASYGYGVDPSLAVESVRADTPEPSIFRSGVYSLVEVRKALARFEGRDEA